MNGEDYILEEEEGDRKIYLLEQIRDLIAHINVDIKNLEQSEHTVENDAFLIVAKSNKKELLERANSILRTLN